MFVLGLVLSLVIGLSLGLLGGGGSILTVPVLHYVFAIDAHDAIAMSLVVVGVTSAVALLPHARAGRVHWRLGGTFGLSSMISAFAGGWLGAMLPDAVLIAAFAVVMAVAGIAMILRSRQRVVVHDPAAVHLGRVLVIGLGVGLLTGTLGAGGGFVIVPVLTMFGGLAIRDAVGTSLLVIAMNAAAGFAGAASHASLDPRITVLVTAIAVAGSFLGARLGRSLSARQLQAGFGVFVVVLGLLVLAGELV